MLAVPATDFTDAQCLCETHKDVKAHIGDVSAPDSSKVGFHTADVTEEVRQVTPRQKTAAVTPLPTWLKPEDRQ